MTTIYLLCVYVHVVTAVLLVGHAMFWSYLALFLPAGRTRELLGVMHRTTWPPEGLPAPIRLTQAGLAWAALAAMIGTGAAILAVEGPRHVIAGEDGLTRYGWALGAKLALVAALVGLQVPLSRRPEPRLVHLRLAAGLVIVVLSVMVAR